MMGPLRGLGMLRSTLFLLFEDEVDTSFCSSSRRLPDPAVLNSGELDAGDCEDCPRMAVKAPFCF